MQLGYVILYVDDVNETVVFFERAFGLSRAFVHESGAFATLDTGSTALAFCERGLAESGLPGRIMRKEADADFPFEVALTTADVDGAYLRALEEGAIAAAEPADKPWGQRTAYVRTPTGHLVELCTPMG